MKQLITEIKKCVVCRPHLENGVNPVVSATAKSKIAIVGQAPGRIVHETGIPWDDKSGERLRGWMDVNDKQFYNADLFGIVPMGFCYPGKGKSGDLPPRKECAPLWHQNLFDKMRDLQLILLIGQYAQQYYLGDKRKKTLTETVRNFEDFLPQYLPLPHPSPRNNIWLAKNEWFEELVLPLLRKKVKSLITEKN